MYSSSTKSCVHTTQHSPADRRRCNISFLSFPPSCLPINVPFSPLSSAAKKGGEGRTSFRRGQTSIKERPPPPPPPALSPPLSCTKSMTLLLLLPKAKHPQRREGAAFSKFLGLASQQKVFRAPLLLTPLCPCMPVLYIRTAGLLPPPFSHFLTAKALLSFGAFLFFPYRL